MAISALTYVIGNSTGLSNNDTCRKVYQAMPVVDFIIGAALTAIALLAMFGIIPQLSGVALPLLVGGATYGGIALLSLINRLVLHVKQSSCCQGSSQANVGPLLIQRH